MNRDQLDIRNASAIRRYSRSIVDTGGEPPQALLDALWDNTCQFAADVLAEQAEPKLVVSSSGGAAGAANLAAAVAGNDAPPVKPSSPGPLPGTSARTRTRTRGGPK